LLLDLDRDFGGRVRIYDVARDFPRCWLGERRTAELNRTLIDADASGLPTADYLTAHLVDAGRTSEAETMIRNGAKHLPMPWPGVILVLWEVGVLSGATLLRGHGAPQQ
jgi:hypothetical protein